MQIHFWVVAYNLFRVAIFLDFVNVLFSPSNVAIFPVCSDQTSCCSILVDFIFLQQNLAQAALAP